MERRDKAPKRKRITTRDEADHDQKKKECRNRGKKKPEIITTCCNNLDKDYSNRDPIGVFDFPWLKEGSCFQVDEFLKPDEDIFAPCSYVDEVQQETFVANDLDQPCVQNSIVPPSLDRNFHDHKLDGDSLCSLRVDDLEPFDCIWSSVLDQPLL